MRPAADARTAAFAERALNLLAGRREEEEREDGLRIVPLAGDGSARTYYRARAHGLRAVVCQHTLAKDRSHPDENEAFLAVREYLAQRGVRVPAFYAADLDRGYLLLEDLGDERLADRVREQRWQPAEPLLALYRQALGALVQMQAPGLPAFGMRMTANPAYTPAFVTAHEAGYFHCELLRGWAALDVPDDAFAAEYAALADEAFAGVDSARLPPAHGSTWGTLTAAEAHLAGLVFMHRDYQSRNLIVTREAIGRGVADAETLAVLDFQGARFGPPEYDLAALLFDPYVNMPAAMRDELIAFYARTAAAAAIPGVPPAPTAAWRRRLLANAANRLMQALGAFAKLGGRAGRPGFERHIPAALESLRAIIRILERTPRLSAQLDALCR